MIKSAVALIICGLAASILFCGCSGESDSGPNPVTSVDIDPDQAAAEVGHSIELPATVSGGSSKSLTWYVDGIQGGNDVIGTITQGSPAAYTAPDSLPMPATITVKAVSVEDTSKYDFCSVDITFMKIFVDPNTGSDETGRGCINNPLKTITHAATKMEVVGMSIIAQPGVYSEATGEIFPIGRQLGGISILGMDWEQCIIRGHAVTGYKSVVSLGGPDLVFRKFTLEQGLPADDCQVALQITGTDVYVDSIRSSERALYAVCRCERSTRPVVENCVFVIDDGEHQDRGINLFPNSTGGIVRNCVLTGFSIGLRITNTSDLLVEGCTIIGNGRGVEVRGEDAPGTLNPDFGGGARGSAGGNTIRDNEECGFRLDISTDVYAKNNFWDYDPPGEGWDYCEDAEGSLILE